MIKLGDDLIRGARGAAQELGCSERQIYHLAETGLIPVVRKGRALWFRRSELERAFTADQAA